MNVIVFGYQQQTDVSNVSHSIEFAFDAYRKNLENMMDVLTQFIKKTQVIDECNDSLYESVHKEIIELSNSLPYYWESNEAVLRKIIKPWDVPFVYGIMPPFFNNDHPSAESCTTQNNSFDYTSSTPSSYNTLTQIFVHLSRDWSSLGVSVRKLLYFQTLLPLVEKYLPILSNNNIPQILIPGSGLGRLGLELVALGYRVGTFFLVVYIVYSF